MCALVLEVVDDGAPDGERPSMWGKSAVVAVSLIAFAQPAWADEEEWILSLEPGWALATQEPTQHAIGGDASVWFGVSEVAWVFATAGFRSFLDVDTPAPERKIQITPAGGLVLALDVLRTIPFAEVGLGLHITQRQQASNTTTNLAPFLRVGLGADYLISPSLSVGGIVRYRPFGATEDRLVSASLRISWRGEL